MKNIFQTITAVLILIFSFGCQQPIEKRLEGNWLLLHSTTKGPKPVFNETVDSDSTILTLFDGRCTILNSQGPLEMQYQITPDSLLLLIQTEEEVTTMQIKALNRKELVLHYPNPNDQNYRELTFEAMKR